jgi:SNF2 family DNA or RNA helicase
MRTKTIIIVSCRDWEPHRAILVVAPNTVITNWQREFGMWGAFRVAIYHGHSDAREAAIQGIMNGTTEVLITSYDTFR